MSICALGRHRGSLRVARAFDGAGGIVRSRLDAKHPHVAKLNAELAEKIGKLEATYDLMFRRERTVSSAA